MCAHLVHWIHAFRQSTTTKTVNFNERLESLLSVSCKHYKHFSKVMNLNSRSRMNMNQTYFEWYEFDVNVLRILIAFCTYKSTLVVVSTNALEYMVKFQYC